MQAIYLDYNSTTPIAGSVRGAMLPFLGDFFGDPNHPHWMGRAVQEALEDARSSVATLLGCSAYEIIFTSGGTESINLAILGAALRIETVSVDPLQRPHMIISAMEHPAVSRSAEALQKRGWQVTRIGCDRQGVIRLDQFESALRRTTRLVSVMHSNHEVGTLQPIHELVGICAGRDILVHSDACQSVSKVPLSVLDLGVDLLSISGHKMYGPKGSGALFIRSGVSIDPIFYGEWQEQGLRPGMEMVPNIVGLGQAARLAARASEDMTDRLALLRDRFLQKMESQVGEDIFVHANQTGRLPNTLSLQLKNRLVSDVIQHVPELYLGPIGHEGRPSSYVGVAPTLAAMGLSPTEAAGTIRISVGWNTTETEIDAAADLLSMAIERTPHAPLNT